MRIRDSVAFVTGANRGLGLAFAQELLAAGARKVYAAARHPERITLDELGITVAKDLRTVMGAVTARRLRHEGVAVVLTGSQRSLIHVSDVAESDELHVSARQY
jgi:nucleoside-diphosphate-sugar epimerase